VATTENDAMMRAVYRFLSMWLFIDADAPTPHEVKLIDYDPLGGDRVMVFTRSLDQLKAWVRIFTGAGFRVTGAAGTSPGYGNLCVSLTGAIYGHPVAHLVILCPSLPSVPAELKALVADDAQTA
jgi:hypothetical protein